MNNWRIIVLMQVILIAALVMSVGVSSLMPPLGFKEGFNMNHVEQGRYLVKIAGCNDCHTPGYLPADGKVAEENWLLGDSFGWRGPWGTTYATNLRTFMNALTEEQWLPITRVLRTRPPMPWFNLNAVHEEDLKALSQFVRYLGTKGDTTPAYLPPDIEPKTPYALFPTPPK